MTHDCPQLHAEIGEPFGWMTFNDPARHNAISMDMARAVPPVMRDFEENDAVRVVIVRGAGERAFAAGSNISAFGDVRNDPKQNHHYHQINEAAYDAVYACSKPTIAMINGYCIGGGLDFATSCDIRICSEHSIFAIPAVRLGLGYGWEGQVRMNRIVGPMHGRDIFFSGRKYNAQEALAMGLVHEVVPADRLKARVEEYAAVIAQNAPMTLKALKQGFLELEREEASRDMGRAQAMIDACFQSADYQEGRQAFAGKRQPNFAGK